MGFVFTVRGGKVVRSEGFLSRAEALEAVGLSEQAMSRENVARLVTYSDRSLSDRCVGQSRSIR